MRGTRLQDFLRDDCANIGLIAAPSPAFREPEAPLGSVRGGVCSRVQTDNLPPVRTPTPAPRGCTATGGRARSLGVQLPPSLSQRPRSLRTWWPEPGAGASRRPSAQARPLAPAGGTAPAGARRGGSSRAALPAAFAPSLSLLRPVPRPLYFCSGSARHCRF